MVQIVLGARPCVHSSLIGQKPMFYQRINKETCILLFLRHYLYNIKQIKKPSKLSITLITRSGHLRTLRSVENTRLRLLFSRFPLCSQVPVMFHHSVIHVLLGFFIC